jgi:hypothetical protein
MMVMVWMVYELLYQAFYLKFSIMAFEKESLGYEKTVLSDLQGIWQNLRETVVKHAGFTGWERALF